MILDKIAYGIGYALTTVVDEISSIPSGFQSGVADKARIDDSVYHTEPGETQDLESSEPKPNLFSQAA